MIVHRTQCALGQGALYPIDTVATELDDAGIRFVVRQVSSLARKAQAQRQPSPRAADPFLPYEPELFVADISPTHVALLNKFNVIEHHLLIVTRAFEDQKTLLTPNDFDAWCRCLAEFDSLGFYNGGTEAGASQRHKHMQMVPLPLGEPSVPVPLAPLLVPMRGSTRIAPLPGLPFENAFAWLPANSTHPLAVEAHTCYRALLDALGIAAGDAGAIMQQSVPYNLLMTTRWMLVVPRTAQSAEGISVNALGFAGSLFVRDAAQLQVLRRLGPMALLRRVARVAAVGA